MNSEIEQQLGRLNVRIVNDQIAVEKEETRVAGVEERNGIWVKLCTWLAWIFVVSGFFVLAHGVNQAMKVESPMPLNEMGDYFGGTIASAWALSGVFFIYVSFLGQRIELAYSRLEQQRSRLQLLYNQKELLNQQFLVDRQIEGMKAESFVLMTNSAIDGIAYENQKATSSNNMTRGDYLTYAYNSAFNNMKDGDSWQDFKTHWYELTVILSRTVELLRELKRNSPISESAIKVFKSKIDVHLIFFLLYEIGIGDAKDLREYVLGIDLFNETLCFELFPNHDLQQFYEGAL